MDANELDEAALAVVVILVTMTRAASLLAAIIVRIVLVLARRALLLVGRRLGLLHDMQAQKGKRLRLPNNEWEMPVLQERYARA